uniref:Murein L,D-transpeptidase YafK n=1 Tax=Candidatus Kentrum sp. UNK TaxID=2126344 RepID=A0A451AHT9_9GAMM|nr:MAG: Murein L,D-transpeptidase YafK [Candidatus Kentron sp. UNK]VFK71595.1 MAG: Murein L,D-transpeptidase YafK [Candidatus Kentron sp. UNK]
MMRRIFSPSPILLAFISALLYIAASEPAVALTLALDLDTQLDTNSLRKPGNDISRTTEGILMDSLVAIRDSRMDAALREMETLVEAHPEFRLAQLIYGDLLLSRGHLITDMGNHPHAPPDKVMALKEEARQRLEHHLHFFRPAALPEYLVRLPKRLARVVIVDISRSRLYLYENHAQGIHLRGDYYASVGKNGFPKRLEGDKKTPIGVYATTGSIPRATLPDRYGAGAFPLNYPNAWDKRFGRTGDGIWIHGVPKDTYSRTPRASDGCVALANTDLLSLKGVLATPNTPVILADRVSWIDYKEMVVRRDRFKAEFDRWRRGWESLDHASYAKYYSLDFRNEVEDRASWLRRKRDINGKKRYIRVGISNLSIFGYPGERNMLVVTFDQDYRSDNFDNRSRKRQYWRLEKNGWEENDTWRILYENTLTPIQ